MTSLKTTFLDLPAELRNRIYSSDLIKHRQIIPTNRSDHQQPALTRTCRQIRKEALPIYYGSNTFALPRCCYACNYGGEHTKPCPLNLPQVRPADWLEAVGHHNLRHVQNLIMWLDMGRDTFTWYLELGQDDGMRGLEIVQHGRLQVDDLMFLGCQRDALGTILARQAASNDGENVFSSGTVEKVMWLMCGGWIQVLETNGCQSLLHNPRSESLKGRIKYNSR